MTVFQCKNPTHDWYKCLESGDSPDSKVLKALLEDWWLKYKPYADSHFCEELGRDFHQRVWEMRLGIDLLNMGIELSPHKEKGPDLCFKWQDKTVWVEAVVSERGDKEDRVPKVESGIAAEVPEREMILRYTSVLYDKYKKYQKYLDNKLIQPDDCFIVAINGFLLGYPDSDDIPYIVKSVYGIGSVFWMYDGSQDKLIDGGYGHKPEIRKKNDSPISQDTFLNTTYPGTTGIIHSNSAPLSTKPIENYLFIHNMMATNKLPIDLFKNWLHFESSNSNLESYRPADMLLGLQ